MEKRSRCERPGLTGNDSWFELASAERMKPDLMGEKKGARCMMGFWRWVDVGFLCSWNLWVDSLGGVAE